MSRRPRIPALLVLTLLLLPAPFAPAEEAAAPVVAVVGARVLPVSGPAIENGTVLWRGGVIEAVGARTDVSIPDGAIVIDAAGLTACPGFVDARSGLFLDATETGRPSSSPDVRAFDGADPFDEDASSVLRAGVTTVFVAPPSGPGVNGAGVALRVHSSGSAGFAVAGEDVLTAALGMSRGRDPGPIVRMGEADGILGILRAAQASRAAGEKYAKDRAAWEKAHAAWKKALEEKKDPASKEPAPKEPAEPAPPRPNPAADALRSVVERRARFRIEARGALGILSALRIAEEASVRVVLEGGDEAGRVFTSLSAARVPVVLGPLVAEDPADAVSPALAKALKDAGVPFAIATFSGPGRASRFLPLHAAAAAAAGLSREDALRAITLDAAVLSGVGARVGSLEVGKDADLVLLTGDPVDSSSRVVRVIARGETVWEARP